MGITINSEALNNAAISLNVIGNNIANINTTGFKQSSFSEELKKPAAVVMLLQQVLAKLFLKAIYRHQQIR